MKCYLLFLLPFFLLPVIYAGEFQLIVYDDSGCKNVIQNLHGYDDSITTWNETYYFEIWNFETAWTVYQDYGYNFGVSTGSDYIYISFYAPGETNMDIFSGFFLFDGAPLKCLPLNNYYFLSGQKSSQKPYYTYIVLSDSPPPSNQTSKQMERINARRNLQ